MFNRFGTGLEKAKTFRPKRNHRIGTKRHELHKYAQATLGTGNLHEAVTLPEGEDLNEWLAVNTVDFFNEINLLYGVIAEFCSEQACPIMCAGPKYEYMWADGLTVKKPMAVSAPRYVDFLMTWVQNQLDDEKLFPTEIGVPFPPEFFERVQNIFKRLFRVYAHICLMPPNPHHLPASAFSPSHQPRYLLHHCFSPGTRGSDQSPFLSRLLPFRANVRPGCGAALEYMLQALHVFCVRVQSHS